MTRTFICATTELLEIMKKLLFLLALSAATPALKPAFAQQLPAVAPFSWALHLRAGQKFLTTNDTSSLTSQQMPVMPGMPKNAAPIKMETKAQTHMTIEQNVLSSDDKGARIEVIYRDISQSSIVRQGDKVVYDSAHPTDALKNMDAMFKAMNGARLSYLLSNDGQISDVQGVEDYLKHLTQGMEKAFGKTPGAGAQQKTMSETMGTFMSPDLIKRSLGEAYRTMPGAPVKLGGTWKYTTTLPVMGTTFTQSGAGTFQSRAAGIVTIAQTGKFSTDGGAEFKIPGVLPKAGTPAPITQLDLRGDSSGQISVDESTGLTVESRTTQNMEGELVMSGLTGVGSTMTIPMKIQTVTTSQTKEVKPTA